MGLSKDAQRLHLLFLVHLSLFILVFITSLTCETRAKVPQVERRWHTRTLSSLFNVHADS